jgi:Tol biopolymer transport system component
VRAIDLAVGVDGPADRILARLPEGVWFQPTAWAPDGSRLAGQERRGNNPRGGVAIYDLSTRRYTRLTSRGGQPIWLNDSRRLVYSDVSSVYMLDTASGRGEELFSVLPYQSSDLTITGDNRHLYASVRQHEADVWVTNSR